MNSLYEQTLTCREVFQGKSFRVEQQLVRMPNGREVVREIVKHPGAVAILPINGHGDVVLVRQYRKAIEREVLEVPAGKIEPGETPEACARRELREETGLEAEQWEYRLSYYISPGFCDEKMHLFHARGLRPTTGNLDDDEDIRVETYSPEQIPALVQDGQIADAKSIIALYSGRLFGGKQE